MFIQCYEELCMPFLMLKDCKINSDVWMPSTDVWQQAPNKKAWSAGVACPAGWGAPTIASHTTPLVVEQIFFMQTHAVQAIEQTGSHAASATTTSATTTDTDATNAKG
jgi:hypothetical protein